MNDSKFGDESYTNSVLIFNKYNAQQREETKYTFLNQNSYEATGSVN